MNNAVFLRSHERPGLGDARGSDEIVSLLAHELRTPLANVISWASLLKSRLTPGEVEVRRGLDVILNSARTQSRLIDHVLDSQRLELGKVRLDRQALLLNTFIDQIVAANAAAAQAAGLKFSVATDATRAARVWADPVRLMQILSNLISNAIKFTPRGGEIVFLTRDEGAYIAITVRDSGRGIPSASLGLIFDSFYQVDSASGTGLGLGLAVVRQLVELHGGRVAVESEGPGKGAAFTVWLSSSRNDG